MFYLVNFAVCFVFCRSEKLTRLACFFIVLSMLFIFGFRDHVGTDWNNYLSIYRFYLLDPEYSNVSRGHVFDYLARAFSTIFDEIHYFNAFLFFIFIFGIVVYSKNLPGGGYFILYALGYLIPVIMVGVRQAAAIGLIFILTAIYHRIGLIRRCLLVLVAAGFHPSALVFISTPFISVLMNSGYRRLSIFLIFLNVIIAFLFGFSSDNYSYLISEAVSSLGALQHIMLIVVPVVLSFLLKRGGRGLKIVENDMHYVMIFILIVSFFVLSVNTTTADRMSLYCYPLVAFAVSQQISTFRLSFLKMGYAATGFMVFWTWYFFANNSATFRNYSNFWL